MVRCSIFYDKDIKEQVFMIRGDERYARSTTTSMVVGNPVLHSENFDLPITINVFRDVGNANIVIYDNDEAVYVIDDWQSTDNARTITLEGLGYDADHILRAKYIGNGQCSPSFSKTESITIPNPYVFDSNITIILPSITNGAMEGIQIILTNTGQPSYNKFQEMELWYDDTLIRRLNTGDNGRVTTSIRDVGDIGLHELKVVFEGSSHLTPCIKTTSVSVGYDIEVLDAPFVAVHGDEATFKVKLTDFIGNPVIHQGVIVYSYSDSTRTSFAQAVTMENGIATLTGTVNSALCTDGFKISSGGANDTDYINVRIVTVNSFIINATPPRLYYGENTNIIVSIADSLPAMEGIPVHITTSIEGTDTTETIYTNTMGQAWKRVRGTGTHSIRDYSARIGNTTKSKSLTDYYAYFSKINEDVMQGNINVTGNLVGLQNQFRLDSTTARYAALTFYDDGKPHSFRYQIEGIVASSAIQIGFGAAEPANIPILLPFRKYTNGKIFVYTNFDVTENTSSFTYEVYDNNVLIYGDTHTEYYPESIVFENQVSNAQQITFKKAWSQLD